ncbi:MAG: HEAT repeat domain-containing protein [Candidatus Omnitrophota bacterium]|nr:HEAT repeat domain-containing protein [Candidatus Omnitrophota bacterium]
MVIDALIQDLSLPNGDVRQAAQETLIAFAHRKVAVDALGSSIPQLVKNLSHPKEYVRQAAQETLTAFAQEKIAVKALGSSVPQLVKNLSRANQDVRQAAQETLMAFARAEIAVDALGLTVPETGNNLSFHDDGDVSQVAQETLTTFAQAGIVVDALGSSVPATVRNLSHPDWLVRQAAQRTLTAFAQAEIAVDALGSSAPATVNNLCHPNGDVRQAAQETLMAFAQAEIAVDALGSSVPELVKYLSHSEMEALDLAPTWLGFPMGVDWKGVARLERVSQELSSLAGYGELTLGGRALLRRKLVWRSASDSEEVLRRFGENWVAHEVRLERLDRSAGLASAGAELHLPVEGDPVALEGLAVRLASGAGDHSMVPWILEGEGRQIDIRLLPAYPGIFRRLLAELLKDEALNGYQVVGAHYSVGVDLKKELVPVALALYYGDEDYLVAPVAGTAEGGVGFPGVWTYRGASLDMMTGQATDQAQSNFHLRPFRTFVGEISLDLFQSDVDRLGWLAAAAAAPEGDPKRQLYREFLRKWERWVEKQGGANLMGTIHAAEQEIGSKSGAGVSPGLDKASADLLAAMVETPEKGTAARKELSDLLKDTLRNLEAVAWGSAAAAKAIDTYRESESLVELDRTLAGAVDVVTREIFSAGKGSPQEERLLKTLEALDPEKAEPVRASLRPEEPPSAGMEEGIEILNPEKLSRLKLSILAWDFDLTVWATSPEGFLFEFLAQSLGIDQNPSENSKLARFWRERSGFSWRELEAKIAEEGWSFVEPGTTEETYFQRQVRALLEQVRQKGLSDPDPAWGNLTAGVVRVLERIHQSSIRQIVVTGADRESRSQISEWLGIRRFFDEVYGGGQKTEAVQGELSRLPPGESPDDIRAAVIGDSLRDVQQANAAGALSIGLALTPEAREAFRAANGDTRPDVLITGDFSDSESVLRILLQPTAGLEELDFLQLPSAPVQVGFGVVASSLKDAGGLPIGAALSRAGVPVAFVVESPVQAAALEELGISAEAIFEIGPGMDLDEVVWAAKSWLGQVRKAEEIIELGVRSRIPWTLEQLFGNLRGILLPAEVLNRLQNWIDRSAELLRAA